MFLTYEQIAACIHGAARVVKQDGCVRLKRFTEEQENLIMVYNTVYLSGYRKTNCTMEGKNVIEGMLDRLRRYGQ